MIHLDEHDMGKIKEDMSKIRKEIDVFNAYIDNELCDRHIEIVSQIVELEKELLDIYTELLKKKGYTNEQMDRVFELCDTVGTLQIKTEDYFPWTVLKNYTTIFSSNFLTKTIV